MIIFPCEVLKSKTGHRKVISQVSD
uniref:Dihydrodipicolinate synthase 2 n=1 Tax=Arundo donax TaxID=35708 RepID=A0A0A8ZJ03_ARUDO